MNGEGRKMLFTKSEIIKWILKRSINNFNEFMKSNEFQLRVDAMTEGLFQKYNDNGKYALIDDICEDDLLQSLLDEYLKNGMDFNKIVESKQIQSLDEDKKIYYLIFLSDITFEISKLVESEMDLGNKLILQRLDKITSLLSSDYNERNRINIEYEYNEVIEELYKKNAVTFNIESSSLMFLDKQISLLEETVFINTNRLVLEHIENAYKHGRATEVKVLVSRDKLLIIDDGVQYNPLERLGKETKLSGGGFTLDYILQSYKNIIKLSHEYCDKNIFVLEFSVHAFNVKSLCEIKVKAESFQYRDIEINIPDYISDVMFFEPDFAYHISGILNILGKLSCVTKGQIPIIVTLDDPMVQRFFRQKIIPDNIYLREVVL